MSDLVPDQATICIVNYKTPDVCGRMRLRSIRKYTDSPHEVRVIDNDSRDASLDYLKRLSWIRSVVTPSRRAGPERVRGLTAPLWTWA